MIISDLNYLELTQETVVGGSSTLDKFKFDKKINIDEKVNKELNFDIDFNEKFKKEAEIKVKSYVEGNSGSFVFENEAIGPDSNTQTTISQLVVAGEGSNQTGSVIAAAN
ncbi:hypothetical protein [Scytonema sp. NUACC26]|uniref:hypothetical protein n=1 Tax=Scytonema sp. NUACC26 TaxID=3140176 RepID=UPI0034DC30D6